MALWAATSSAQQLEKDRGRTGPPIRPEREIRNLPATLPALPRIQAIAITVRDRIEHQQRLASAESAPLGRGEERRTDTSPPQLLCGDFNAMPDSDEIRMITGLTATPVPGIVFQDAWTAV